MDSYIEVCARNVMRNRILAKDKTFQYRTRLMFDKCAARWEALLINRADAIIAGVFARG